jgi:hypothetical protein
MLLLNIIMSIGAQSPVSGRGIYRLGRQMIGRKLVIRVLQLRNRFGLYVVSIYATGQLRQHRQLQAHLAFADYPHKQSTIACEKLDCEPDDLILVPSWEDNIGEHESDGATQLGTGL